MNLSPHFTLDELTIRNRVKGVDAPRLYPGARASLVDLCGVLEVIRARVGEPVHVTSGFRHGDPLQHGRGQAADIQVRSLSPLGLLSIIGDLAETGRVKVRQVIAESNHTDRESLSRPMLEGSGLWVHVAIFGPGFERPSSAPWSTSTAPLPGQKRVYVRWAP